MVDSGVEIFQSSEGIADVAITWNFKDQRLDTHVRGPKSKLVSLIVLRDTLNHMIDTYPHNQPEGHGESVTTQIVDEKHTGEEEGR